MSTVKTDKSSSGDEIPERDVTYHLKLRLIYHWTATHLYSEIFWSNSYISNGRRFTKSAFRILLLSTLRVSRRNYFLVCSLPIHTGSSANIEGLRAHCLLNSCKMLHKCSTDCIWKGMQPVNDLEGHWRSPPLLPFDRPYTISYQSYIVTISLFCTVFEILTLICQKVKTSRDIDHAHLGNILSLQD